MRSTNSVNADLSGFNNPFALYIDSSDNIYVTDRYNQRIVKWVPGASEGVVVAGGNYGSELENFRYLSERSTPISKEFYLLLFSLNLTKINQNHSNFNHIRKSRKIKILIYSGPL